MAPDERLLAHIIATLIRGKGPLGNFGALAIDRPFAKQVLCALEAATDFEGLARILIDAKQQKALAYAMDLVNRLDGLGHEDLN